MFFLNKLFGDPNAREIKKIQPIIDKINSLESKIERLSNDELRNKTAEFRKRLEIDEKIDLKDEKYLKTINERLDNILPEAFAVVREAAKRVLGERHYDVQLIGGIVLHRGQIAEMKTGEGKTLVATLALYLNALAKRGAYLVTVNDYLAKLGAGWMGKVYDALGIKVGVITHEEAFIYDPEYNDNSQYDERLKHFRLVSRKQAYQADITYGTNNEFGFDYLRDNMAQSLDQCVQRELNYAIVDEVDSILIDEARTPLIISAPAEESNDKYYKFANLIKQLKENEDYNVDEKMRTATLTEKGISKMEKWLGVENIYTKGGIDEVHHIEQALKANVLFKKDKDYIVKDGEVVIVDEFTGRLMKGRRYSEGLHQAIEAKENVKIQRESQTLATITFQNYFRMFNKLAGMTGTALTEAEEFSKIYNLETVVIPTNKPVIREDRTDLVYKTEIGKFKAIVQEVKRRHKNGQPVLIGTISIEKNEILASMLEKEGIKPQVLNAKNHQKEAQIISMAGKIGAVTIATNMAGRGVDIILGGRYEKNPQEFSEKNNSSKINSLHNFSDWQDEHNKVVKLGGLFVIGTERHESRRIDNQLRGRAGRQGDPGVSQFYISTEDDLMRIFGGDRMKKIMERFNFPEDAPIKNKLISKSIESAQKKVEGYNFDLRKHLVEYDDVINKHREAIYKRRREILETFENKSEKIKNIILEMIKTEIEQVVSFHTIGEDEKQWNLKEIYQTIDSIFPVDKTVLDKIKHLTNIQDKLDKAKKKTEIVKYLFDLAEQKYKELEQAIIDLNKLVESGGLSLLEIEKSVLIRSIDTIWTEHLDAMEQMRQGIGLRGYGQLDPLVEYKKEAYFLFHQLNDLIRKQVVYSIYKMVDVSQIVAPSILQKAKEFSAPKKTMDNTNSSFSQFKQPLNNKNNSNVTNDLVVRQKLKDASGKKIGRNDPCPCGSGKKYKYCCGRDL